ncbi:MAG: hypothetical protein Ct9H90mP9_5500 [Pseudomonadota bacterium]|nr:MAG: hypothetical protein Ct9H90mP9_5500 [Pseudomonadota bacterium]
MSCSTPCSAYFFETFRIHSNQLKTPFPQKKTGQSFCGFPNPFLVLITSLAWMVIIPFELTSQSLLSDPEWLARHDTPPPETDEIDTDNISGYDRQVIEELMGLKPGF